MSQRPPQSNDPERFANDDAGAAHLDVLKALGDNTRLRLLRLLCREELNVQELADILDIAQPRISRHLAVLRHAGLVSDRREGTKVYCTLAPSASGLGVLGQYVDALGKSPHPDLTRLDERLQARARHARSFADRSAEHWDQIGKRLHNSTASMLALARLVTAPLRLADCGTGTGAMLPFLAALGTHVYAIDQSPRMLAQARARCRQLGIDNVTFIQAALEHLDNRHVPECDGLLLHIVLHQVPRPQALLQHLCGLLRPGGRVVVVDRVAHQDERAKTAFGSVWLGFAREQMHQWFGEAGLSDVRWQSGTEAWSEEQGDIELFVCAGTKKTPDDCG